MIKVPKAYGAKGNGLFVKISQVFAAGAQKIELKDLFLKTRGFNFKSEVQKAFQNIKALKSRDIRNLFQKPFNRRMGAVAVLVIFLVSYFLQTTSQTQGAQFTFAQTDWSGGVTANTAVHPTNENGWNQYSAGTNVVTNVAGQGGLIRRSRHCWPIRRQKL